MIGAGHNIVGFFALSGKTHTMLGNPADPGVIPRSIDDIFNHIHSASPEKQFLVRISYMEIYNENLTDLLVEVEKEYVLDNFPFSF